MKFYLNIICNKKSGRSIREQIDSFVCFLDAELICLEEKTYWKEEMCFQFLGELSCAKYDFETMQETIALFWSKEHKVCCFEEQRYVEFAVYASIPEILQNDKVYFTINFTKG